MKRIGILTEWRRCIGHERSGSGDCAKGALYGNGGLCDRSRIRRASGWKY